MLVTIKRKELPTKTAGQILVDGIHFGYTLEDPVRPADQFEKGNTAIPYGRYRLSISFSNRFKKRMILVTNVRGSNILFHGTSIDACGIRIHGGNSVADTLGCPLLGAKQKSDGDIYECAGVNEKLLSMVEEHDKFEEVYLEIVKDNGNRSESAI